MEYSSGLLLIYGGGDLLHQGSDLLHQAITLPISRGESRRRRSPALLRISLFEDLPDGFCGDIGEGGVVGGGGSDSPGRSWEAERPRESI